MTGLLRKDGTIPALKKDGTPRIAGGGYDAEKQKKWCTGVLKRATQTANELFPRCEVLAVLAQYSATDSGYDGVKHIFATQTKIRISTLLKKFSKLSQKKIFLSKYQKFLKIMDNKNFHEILKNVNKSKKK
jgi:hypothetical protein